MGFRNLGNFSIEAGQSFRIDFWTWSNGADHGVQYFSAHPLGPDAMLIISNQSKVMDANGNFFYGFRVTNAGPNSVSFTVEGGGVDDGYRDDPFDDGFWTLTPGAVMGGGTTARNTSGPQYQTMTPLDPDGSIVTLKQDAQVSYFPFDSEPTWGCLFTNRGPNFVAGVIEGGALANQFNGEGEFTIAGGETFRLDGWSWSDGRDRGPQHFSAIPPDTWGYIGTLWTSEQSKMLGSDGRFYYGFRVLCWISYGYSFDSTGRYRSGMPFRVQGGGFS